jgi:hypothetical protein
MAQTCKPSPITLHSSDQVQKDSAHQSTVLCIWPIPLRNTPTLPPPALSGRILLTSEPHRAIRRMRRNSSAIPLAVVSVGAITTASAFVLGHVGFSLQPTTTPVQRRIRPDFGHLPTTVSRSAFSSTELASTLPWQSSWNSTSLASTVEILQKSSFARDFAESFQMQNCKLLLPDATNANRDDICPNIVGQGVRNYAANLQATCETDPVESQSTALRRFQVYCDLDGVLVDFAQGISQLFDENDRAGGGFTNWTSQNIDALPRRLLWSKVKSAGAFFERLPWCHGGRELWTALAPLRPDILTGVPSYCTWAPRMEKFVWCQRELGRAIEDSSLLVPAQFTHLDKAGRFRQHYSVNAIMDDPMRTVSYKEAGRSIATGSNDWHCRVITCWSEQKHHESGPGVVLIDDRISLRPAWEAKGGIFIHHITGNVEHTLQQLRQYGILPRDDQYSQPNNNEWHNTYLRP